MNDDPALVLTPDHTAHQAFTDAAEAVTRLEELYAEATAFLSRHFSAAVTAGKPGTRMRAYYPCLLYTSRCV